MSLAGCAGSSSYRSMYSWLASGPAYLRYLVSPVIRYVSMSPLMNNAVNQVFGVELLWPDIQWSAAARIGVRSGQAGGAGCTAGAATVAADAVDATIAIPGSSPAATTAATAVPSLCLFTGASSWYDRCRSQSQTTDPEQSMNVSTRRTEAQINARRCRRVPASRPRSACRPAPPGSVPGSAGPPPTRRSPGAARSGWAGPATG